MSQENQSKPRNGGGQSRQGGNNNSNRNRNRNQNRSKNRNRQGGQGGKGGGQGRQSGGGPRKRQPKPIPLTFWEKILKVFGLYKAPTRPPRRKPASKNAASDNKKPAKSNTRNARGKVNQGQDTGPIKAKGRGAGEKGREFPVETPRLYLGNLSYDASEQDLEDLFKGIGTVCSVEIIYNRHTHRSKGYGFIEMLSVEEAKSAVEKLHDQEFMGRNLIVNGANAKPTEERKPREDKPREDKPRDAKPTKQRGDRRSNAARLLLSNISHDADESSIEELFKGIGNVRRVELNYNHETHKPEGTGFIDMQKAEDAERAIEVLNDQPFMGLKLIVSAEQSKAEEQPSTPEEPGPVAEPEETPAEENPAVKAE